MSELERYFSNAVVTWKITNLQLAFCPPDTNVVSPDFLISGPRETLWRLYLNSNETEEHADLRLQFLGDRTGSASSVSTFPAFRLRWFAHLVYPKTVKEPPVVKDRQQHVTGGIQLVERFHLTDIMGALSRKKPDRLKIRCYMMINFGGTFNARTSVPCGLKALSNSLAELIEKPMFPDLKVTASDKVYDVHKDMLFRRGYGFSRLMSQQGSDSGLSLQEYDSSVVEAVLSYLYSGKLEYILSSPTIATYSFIERLEIPELKNVYPKQIIKIESHIESKDLSDFWELDNVGQQTDSPEFYHPATNTRWRLHFFPKGTPVDGEVEEKFGLLQVSLLHSVTSLDVYFKVNILNENDNTLKVKKQFRRMNAGSKLKIRFFYRTVNSAGNGGIKKPLSFSFGIRIATGEETREVRKVKPPRPYHLTNNQSLVILSRMMGAVLERPDHYDLKIHHERHYICVHKFLLAARSPNLKIKIVELGSGDVLTIPNITRHELRVFLEYLYTGLLNDYGYATIMLMYQLACFYAIPDLKVIANLCGKMTPQNVLEILMYADDKRITHLKSEAMQLIAEIGEEIKENHLWKFFTHKKPELAVDVLDFIGRAYEDVDQAENIAEQNIIYEE